MLIATTIVLLGLLAGIAAAQLRGLRMGGVIVVPLVAVYLLRSFGTFPVFVISILAAYVAIGFVKQRVPLYGRQLFVLSILVGALVPVTAFELVAFGFDFRGAVAGVEFVGSILPGIAAYNFHRLELEERVLDAVVSLATLLFLTVVGIGLTIFVGLTPLSEVLSPLLLSPESDIAIAFGLTVDRPPLPVIASNRLTLGLVALGMAIAEFLRARYGLRVAGVIVLPLVALIAFRNVWLLPVWVVTSVLVYVGVRFVHRWTLLYGRVLLAVGIILGLLATISLSVVVPTRHGLLPFFVGLFGGITAYNVHVVPPAERPATVAATLAVLVVVTFAARLAIVPPPSGVLQDVRQVHLAAGALATVPALVAIYRLERIRPDGLRGSGLDDHGSGTERGAGRQ
ncbi:poly-gamma-glutamate biosynthesis protein PgsC/CapC [Haloarcula litorea]|uniref:poly-gamma-glutamate biosynthesis protein PgsC/CapC n=1 Tax=Haloarcula litorea TaxID=3032579 RepID=UPI0023E8693E|nr:poly-gamma-glutamate biosynthesis protein PgsC/CapC [Halomicroarcula sp. GDY20]